MAAVFLLRTQESRPATFIDGLMGLYGRVLGFTLRNRLLFVLSIIGMFAAVVYLFTTIEKSFAARSLERQVIIKVDTPRQYSLAQTRALYDEVYAALDSRRDDLDIEHISHSFRVSAGRSRGWSRSNRFELYLRDEEQSTRDTGEIRNLVESLLPERPGVKFTLSRSRRGHRGSGSGVELRLLGDRMDVLEVLGRRVTEALAARGNPASSVQRIVPSLEDVFIHHVEEEEARRAAEA